MAPLAPSPCEATKVLVSVVVPAFDSAATIEGTLRSLTEQSWSELEILAVDDGSGDATPELIAAAAVADPRIRLLRQERNGGVSEARNAGLAAARGSWILFMDADDRLVAGHIEALLGAATAAAARAAFSGWRFADATGSLGRAGQARPVPDFMAVCAERCPFPIHTCLVRRDDVLAVGGFDPGLTFAEDWDLWQRLARLGVRPVPAAGSTAIYHLTPGSATGRIENALAQGLRVIDNAFAPDPRVPPTARFAAGLDPAGRACARLPFLMRQLGHRITAGLPLAPLMTELDPAVIETMPVPELARHLIGGLLFAAGIVPAALPSIWPALLPVLRAGLEAFGTAVGEPHLGTAVLEEAALGAIELIDRQALPLTMPPVRAGRIAVGEPLPALTVPAGVTRLRLYAAVGDERGTPVDLASGAGPPPAFVAEAVAAAKEGALVRRWLKRSWRRQPRIIVKLARLGGSRRRRRLVQALWRLRGKAERRLRLRAWIGIEARRLVPAFSPVPGPDTALPPAGTAPRHAGDPWATWFETTDPWGYGSAYEQQKFAHSIETLNGIRAADALELACAEGHFTLHLAAIADTVLATDIAAAAIARAAERCAHLPHVRCVRLDFRDQPIPGTFDLIVCSEVLYYLRDREELRNVVRRLAAHLRPGGRLLTTHSNLLVDDADRTGFDWAMGFGARTIAETLATLPGLDHVRELRTPLYSCELFVKSKVRERGTLRPRERLERLPHWPEDLEIAGKIVTGGAALTLPEANGTLVTRNLPVLMYHQIAADGPQALAPYRLHPDHFEAQLRYLRRHGYRSIDLATWVEALRRGPGEVFGRAVIFTFDDGYLDFARTAWPLLQKYGFGATVFLVADRIGGAADWDARFGEPAPLMDWPTIRRLAAQGVVFGAHSCTHPHLERLGSKALVTELERSRAIIETGLGRPIDSMAYPFGGVDSLVRNAAAAAGFRTAVTLTHGLSRYGDDPLLLPRLDMAGGLDIDRLVAWLGRPAPARRRDRRAYARARKLGRATWR